MKTLAVILSMLPFFVFGKGITKEKIDDTHKYILYESLYFNMTPAEIIGLHCLSTKSPPNSLIEIYPNLKDDAFAIKDINKNICEMAMKGLLSFEEIDRYTNEMKQEYNQKSIKNL
ncbi:TPA: hypothetical protein ACS7YQ_003855 [Providencia alcalifaciens]